LQPTSVQSLIRFFEFFWSPTLAEATALTAWISRTFYRLAAQLPVFNLLSGQIFVYLCAAGRHDALMKVQFGVLIAVQDGVYMGHQKLKTKTVNLRISGI